MAVGWGSAQLIRSEHGLPVVDMYGHGVEFGVSSTSNRTGKLAVNPSAPGSVTLKMSVTELTPPKTGKLKCVSVPMLNSVLVSMATFEVASKPSPDRLELPDGVPQRT